MRFRFHSALVLIVAATVTMNSCETADNPDSPAREGKANLHLGGTVRMALPSAPSALEPQNMTDAISSEVGVQLHCGLLRLDPESLEPAPGIAESWSLDEKGTTFLFQLRSDAKFHPFQDRNSLERTVTSQDVIRSFKRLCSPDSKAFESTFKNRVVGANAFHTGETEELSGVRSIDDRTVSITLTQPDRSFLHILAQPATAIVLEEGRIGAGPFKLEQMDGTHIALVRNPEYFKKDAFGNRLPYIDTLIFRFIPTKEEQLRALFNGELNLVRNIFPDAVKHILEAHVNAFSGKDPEYLMQRDTLATGKERFYIYESGLKGIPVNQLNHHDLSMLQKVKS